MRIRGNWNSLVTWRSFSNSTANVENHLRKLSSGLRINSAADDAAGLSISTRLKGQFSGLMRANRNAMDGLSLVNTAEGALNEVHNLMQRGRELTLQAANGTLTTNERVIIQAEIDNILKEIDRIADSVTFNGQRLLNRGGNAALIGQVMNGLRSSWLEKAEEVIRAWYGLEADNSQLNIVFERSGPTSAWISGTSAGPTGEGRLENLTLHINLNDFGNPEGFTGPLFNDRKVARALTMAVMARTTNYENLDRWFVSGAADYISGRHEMLLRDIQQHGVATVINAIDQPWNEHSSLHQSSAYLLVRYIGDMANMDNIMWYLANNDDLDTALSMTTGMDKASWINEFKQYGADYLATLALSNDADVGGVGGGDAVTVIPDDGSYSLNPLTGFAVNWANASPSEPVELYLQVGANAHETLRILIPEMSTFSLGLVGMDVVRRAGEATTMFDAAINQVSQARTYLGSISNRLDHTISVNAQNSENQISGFSRIVDADMARELSEMTRNQILVSSSSAMLAQSNTIRQNVMWLLRDLPFGGMSSFSFG